MNTKTSTNYNYNSLTKEITINDFAGSIEQIKLINNVTRGVEIYNPQEPTKTGTLSGNILTLNSTEAGSNTDKLEIIFEDSANQSVNISNTPNVNINSLPSVKLDGNEAVVTAVINALNLNELTGTPTPGSFLTIDTKGASYVSFGVTGTFVATLKAYGSNDNGTFVLISGSILTIASPQNAFSSQVSATGFYLVPTYGAKFVRISCSLFTSGSVNVFAKASSVVVPEFVSKLIGISTLPNTNLSNLPISLATYESNTARTTNGNGILFNPSSKVFTVYANVSSVSGTSPTLDLVVQQSFDGVNWEDIYHFERIITNGLYKSANITLEATNFRVIRTISGASASFTYSVSINFHADTSIKVSKRIIDRTLAILTASSVLNIGAIFENSRKLQIQVKGNGTFTTQPIVAIEGSENGIDYSQIGTITFNNAIAVINTLDVFGKFTRLRVATAGVGGTLDFISVRGLLL